MPALQDEKKHQPAMGGGGKKPPKKTKIGTGGNKEPNDNKYGKPMKGDPSMFGKPQDWQIKPSKNEKNKQRLNKQPKGDRIGPSKEPQDIGKKPNDYKKPGTKRTKPKEQFSEKIKKDEKDRSSKYNTKGK